MISIRFLCPHGHRLIADEPDAGKKDQCPICHAKLIIPVRDPKPSGKNKKEWNAGEQAAEKEQAEPVAATTSQLSSHTSPSTGPVAAEDSINFDDALGLIQPEFIPIEEDAEDQVTAHQEEPKEQPKVELSDLDLDDVDWDELPDAPRDRRKEAETEKIPEAEKEQAKEEEKLPNRFAEFMPEKKTEPESKEQEEVSEKSEPAQEEPKPEQPAASSSEPAKVFHGDIQFGSPSVPESTSVSTSQTTDSQPETSKSANLESISFSVPPEPQPQEPQPSSSHRQTANLESISFSSPPESTQASAPTVPDATTPPNVPVVPAAETPPPPPPPATPPATLDAGPMSPQQAVANEAAQAAVQPTQEPEPMSESVKAITPDTVSGDDIVASLQSEIAADLETQVPDLTSRLAGRTFENVSEKFADRIGRGNKQTIKWLALFMIMAIGFTTIPAFKYYELSEAPGWANAVWIISALQFVYVCWIVLLPDWSTVWVGMVLFALTAGIYALCFGIVFFSPPDKEIILQLDMIRSKAPGWCVCIVLLMGMMSFLCSRLANKWRRAYELAKAGRITP